MAVSLKYLNQFTAVLAASLAVLSVGCAVGWTTPTIKRLRRPGSEIPLSGSQSSWLAGAHELGHILSPLPAGYLLHRVGRKPCLYFADALCLLGWVLVLATRSVPVLYCVRLLFGLAMGIVFTVVPIYIGEVSSPGVRGAFSTCFQAALNLGHVVEFSAGPYVSYGALAWLSLGVSALFFVGSPFFPESPRYLVRRDRPRARAVLARLLREDDPEALDREMEAVEKSSDDQSGARAKDLFSPSYRKKLWVVVVVAVAQRFTGMSAVVAYAATTFSSSGALTADQYTILFGVIGFLFTFVSAALLDTLGRRPLMLLSCAGCGLFQLLTGLYFYFSPKELGWLAFASITLFSVLYSLGVGSLVNTLQGELFPPPIKGLASSLTTIAHGLSSFAVTKLFQVIKDDWHIYWNFFIYAIFCAVSSIFALFAVPETKRKSLNEIDETVI